MLCGAKLVILMKNDTKTICIILLILETFRQVSLIIINLKVQNNGNS